MSTYIRDVGVGDFVGDVVERSHQVPVVVDFWAEWCAPCRMMAPTIDALAAQYDGKAKIGKLNVDENMVVSEKYQIRGIPTVLIIKNGQVAEQVVGVTSKENLSKLIEKHLS